MVGISVRIDTEGFWPATLDKVNRLLTVLDNLGRHPVLKGKVCMHGGTAINLFMLNIPRLSVDIDLSYIGSKDREEMLAGRPCIEEAIEEVAVHLGYAVPRKTSDHAGRTFRLRYTGEQGPDQIKIDMIYLNRVPLLAPQRRVCSLQPKMEVLMFADFELAAGKVKALYDRVKLRDLYDIGNLLEHFDTFFCRNPETERDFHKLALYYASLSKRFPLSLEHRATERFSGRTAEMEEQLYQVLRTTDRPQLEALIASAEIFTERYVLPKDEAEIEYLACLERADYQPSLLFGEGTEITARAQENPEALWKLQNLKKMSQSSS